MKLVELTEKEYQEFAKNHELGNFLQTVCWGKLKTHNGWKYHLLGVKEKKKIVAGGVLLEKSTPVRKNVFYAPHGFLLDYSDSKFVEEFYLAVKDFVKSHNGLFLKVEPYVSFHERDKYGEIVEGGEDNSKVVSTLESLGFKRQCTDGSQTLQASWMYVIDINGRTLDEVMKDMDSKTRQMIRKNEKNGVFVREGSYEELEKFQDIMEHTSDRREFLNRPLSYYQNMYKEFDKEGISKLYFAEIDIPKTLKEIDEEKQTIRREYDLREKQKASGKLTMKEDKFHQKQKESLDAIEKLDARVLELRELRENYGDVVVLGSILFMIYGGEVLSFAGGSYREFSKYQPFYSLYFELIKYAVENGYKRYNFYGISSNLTESDPMYGVYLFKRGFGGRVVELIGEYDLPISKFYYTLYKVSYKVVHKLKKLKTKLH